MIDREKIRRLVTLHIMDINPDRDNAIDYTAPKAIMILLYVIRSWPPGLQNMVLSEIHAHCQVRIGRVVAMGSLLLAVEPMDICLAMLSVKGIKYE